MNSNFNDDKEKEIAKNTKKTLIIAVTSIAIITVVGMILFNSNSSMNYLKSFILYLFNLSDISKVNKAAKWVASMFFIALYILFFYNIKFLPEELQNLVMGDTYFKETNDYFNIDFGNILGISNEDVRQKVFMSLYYLNIICIFIYFNYGLNESTTFTQRLTFILSICMMYLLFVAMIIWIHSSDTKSSISTAQLQGGFAIFSVVSAILAYILNKLGMEKALLFAPLPELHLITRILLFIPCVYIYLINFIKDQMKSTAPTSLIILIIEIVIITTYLSLKNTTLFTPKVLLNDPVHLDVEKVLAQDSEILGPDQLKRYKSALSFWVNINVIKNKNKEYNIIKITDKYEITYNEYYDELALIVYTEGGVGGNNKHKYLTKNNIPLQKWNNFIINYDSGTLDVFMNNELIISQPNVILGVKSASIISGEDKGLNGGICNVRYFNRVLKAQEIKNIYNKSKNKNPPVI